MVVKYIRFKPTTLYKVPECYGSPDDSSKCQLCLAGRYCREGILRVEKEVETK